MTPPPDIRGLSPQAGHAAAGDMQTPHQKLADKIADCPLCSAALEKGYITSQASMEWRTQLIQRSPGQPLTRRAMAGRGFNLPAYRCTACGFLAALQRL